MQCFKVFYEDIERRIDPLYYASNIYHFIKHSNFSMVELNNLVEYFKTGFAAGKAQQDLTGEGIIQIRPTNIDDNGNFIFDKKIFIDKKKLAQKNDDILIKTEVLFNNTNSQELVGKSVFFNLKENYFCSNHITRIKVDRRKLIPEYLTFILNFYREKQVFYNICTNWNNQSGISINLLKTLKIPVPPIEIQNKIANEVQIRIDKAKKLRAEAKTIIEQARTEVENIILG